MGKKIKSEHHRGRNVEIITVLCALAGQEGCDGSLYDEMMEAAEYIGELEQKVRELEDELKPHRDAEERLYRRIKAIDERDKRAMAEEKEKDFEEALTVEQNSHINQPVLNPEDHNGCCIICGRSRLYPDPATVTDECAYCGQHYRRLR